MGGSGSAPEPNLSLFQHAYCELLHIRPLQQQHSALELVVDRRGDPGECGFVDLARERIATVVVNPVKDRHRSFLSEAKRGELLATGASGHIEGKAPTRGILIHELGDGPI